MKQAHDYLEPRCEVIELSLEQGIAIGSPNYNGMGDEYEWVSIS